MIDAKVAKTIALIKQDQNNRIVKAQQQKEAREHAKFVKNQIPLVLAIILDHIQKAANDGQLSYSHNIYDYTILEAIKVELRKLGYTMEETFVEAYNDYEAYSDRPHTYLKIMWQ